jgi:mRNA interferase MazF
MAYIGPVRRWDLFWVDLEPHVGSEQGGERRPAVVVSNDGVNAQLSVVTVLSATSAEGKQRTPYPFEVVLPEGMITAGRGSIIMPQQIRTISKWRLLEKIGQLHDVVMQREIENRLLEHLGIQFEAEGLEPSM